MIQLINTSITEMIRSMNVDVSIIFELFDSHSRSVSLFRENVYYEREEECNRININFDLQSYATFDPCSR